MIVNNLELPSELLRIQEVERMISLDKPNVVSSREMILYGLRSILKETENLLNIYKVQVLNEDVPGYEFFKAEMNYFGENSTAISPGNLDMEQAIVIGDFGPDSPICLDYRQNAKNPKVVVLTSGLLWLSVADCYQDFIDSLGME